MTVRLVALALTLTAASSAPAYDAPQPRRLIDPDRIICRDLPQPGSRLRAARACGTAAEWSAYLAQVREGMRRIQGTGSTFCTPNTRVPSSTCR